MALPSQARFPQPELTDLPEDLRTRIGQLLIVHTKGPVNTDLNNINEAPRQALHDQCGHDVCSQPGIWSDTVEHIANLWIQCSHSADIGIRPAVPELVSAVMVQ